MVEELCELLVPEGADIEAGNGIGKTFRSLIDIRAL